MKKTPEEFAIHANPWPLQLLPVVVAQDSYLFVSLNWTDKRAVVLTIKQKFNNLQTFATMVGAMLYCIQDENIFL